ncbi:MAG: hypothetical protein FWD87_05905 [Spirochaetaceae bacterium]|nr:hypothetical protein [Spirochaetaceae bacterium]
MKKINKCFVLIILAAITGLLLAGCASIFHSVSIRTDGNVSSVLAGGTLNLRATGRSIQWTVSSTSNGAGAVTPGTSITQTGMLTVAANETASILYVIATSTRDGFSDIRPIRVVTVSGVTVTPMNQMVVAGSTLQFRAQVMGTNNPDNTVTWRVSSSAAGAGAVAAGTSINANGLLSVANNETFRTLYITATSVVDRSRSNTVSASVVVPTVTSVTVSPPNQSLRSGSSVQFAASVVGTHNPSTAVIWRVSSDIGGTGPVTAGTSIDINGVLTVAPNETITTLFITATSVFDSTKSGTAHVSVIIPIVTGVAVSPPSQSLRSGSSLQFTASVMGTNNPANIVTWRVSSNIAGTGAVTAGTNINANGLLTIAPNETMTTLFITATSVANPAISGNASVSVIIPIVTAVVVSPPNQSTTSGNSVQLSASVVGTNNPSNAVTWRVSSNLAGTGAVTAGTSINANGLLTVSANEPTRTLYIFATSVADPSRSGNASVSVTSPVAPPVTPPVQPPVQPPVTPPVVSPTVTSVTVTPATRSTRVNTTVQFNASVAGTNNPSTAVTWRVSSNVAGTGAVTAGTSINANGLLTVAANEVARTLYVIATSVADPSRSGSATVTVTRPGNQDGQGQNQQ